MSVILVVAVKFVAEAVPLVVFSSLALHFHPACCCWTSWVQLSMKRLNKPLLRQSANDVVRGVSGLVSLSWMCEWHD